MIYAIVGIMLAFSPLWFPWLFIGTAVVYGLTAEAINNMIDWAREKGWILIAVMVLAGCSSAPVLVSDSPIRCIRQETKMAEPVTVQTVKAPKKHIHRAKIVHKVQPIKCHVQMEDKQDWSTALICFLAAVLAVLFLIGSRRE